jgi:hypothetical protein
MTAGPLPSSYVSIDTGCDHLAVPVHEFSFMCEVTGAVAGVEVVA